MREYNDKRRQCETITLITCLSTTTQEKSIIIFFYLRKPASFNMYSRVPYVLPYKDDWGPYKINIDRTENRLKKLFVLDVDKEINTTSTWQRKQYSSKGIPHHMRWGVNYSKKTSEIFWSCINFPFFIDFSLILSIFPDFFSNFLRSFDFFTDFFNFFF